MAIWRRFFFLPTIVLFWAASNVMAADWRLMDEVKYYQEPSSNEAKQFVGSAIVNAPSYDRCINIWRPIEERLKAADSFLILHSVPRAACPAFIRAIYQRAGNSSWQLVDSTKSGLFEIPVHEAMARALLDQVEPKDQFDDSVITTDHQIHTYLTVYLNGRTIRQGFTDIPGGGDTGQTRLFAKLYFLARSIEGLSYNAAMK